MGGGSAMDGNVLIAMMLIHTTMKIKFLNSFEYLPDQFAPLNSYNRIKNKIYHAVNKVYSLIEYKLCTGLILFLT
jgi:hypothetical protein